MKEISFAIQNPFTLQWENAHESIHKLVEGNLRKSVPSKLRFFNTGPTAFDKKRAWKIYDRQGNCYQVVEIWYRNDGFNNRVFIYESEAEYDNWVIDDHTPYAIDKEWGL